jgi:hypothetical protein
VSALTARQARTRFLVLTALRWLPTGLTMPVLVLLPLDRGLTLAEVGLAVSVQGIVVLALELPTGGLSDSLGRRPVLLLSAVLAVAATGLIAYADSPALLFTAFLVSGIHRALDSGPLEAWYVDATLAADPDARLHRGLSAAGTVVGLAIAAGALAAAGVVALDPLPGGNPLVLPVLVAAALYAADVVAIALLMTEPRRAGRGAGAFVRSVRAVPGVVGDGLRLVRRNRVLATVVSVEIFWGFGMATFEALPAVRLTELLGDPDAAAALMGPATAAAWLASAGGAALASLAGRRVPVAVAAGALRVVQGATVVGMGLAVGPAGVLAGFFACYVAHGASNPLHMALLHREVDASRRATVVSLNGMVSQPAGSVGMIVLTSLAGATSTATAMLAGGVVLALAAPLYLPAWRAGRRAAPAPRDDVEVAVADPGVGL